MGYVSRVLCCSLFSIFGSSSFAFSANISPTRDETDLVNTTSRAQASSWVIHLESRLSTETDNTVLSVPRLETSSDRVTSEQLATPAVENRMLPNDGNRSPAVASASASLINTDANCAQRPQPVRPKYVVGDSLTVGVDLAGFSDISARRCLNVVRFDAEVGRTTAEAIDVVSSWGVLPEDAVVLVGLGTNDTWSSRKHFAEDAERLLDVIGDRDVVWVDVSDGLPRSGAHLNEVLRDLASTRQRVSVVDWSAYETAHRVVRAHDGVHYSIKQYEKRSDFYGLVLHSYDLGRSRFRTAPQLP